ncbi:hypothetical protein SALBM311S_04209 [Streptomyces alboniger]
MPGTRDSTALEKHEHEPQDFGAADRSGSAGARARCLWWIRTAGSGGGDAIVVGTTDQFTATKDAPAPLDPAYSYDVGTWNILRQTVQTLMIQPQARATLFPGRRELRFHRQRQRALRLQTARRPEVLQRRRHHRRGREVLHRPRPRHQGRLRRVRAAVHHRHGRDAGRQRSHLPPQTADATFPFKLDPRSPASSTPTTTTRASCATASRSTAAPARSSRPRPTATR